MFTRPRWIWALLFFRRSRRITTDRNRTSAFAFTGNKFEFRSLGSAVTSRVQTLR